MSDISTNAKPSQASTDKRRAIVRISIFIATLGLLMCTLSLRAKE